MPEVPIFAAYVYGAAEVKVDLKAEIKYLVI